MELQKINSISLNNKEGKKDIWSESEFDLDYEIIEKTTQRLSQPQKSFKTQRLQITAVFFSTEILTVFYGLSSGRVGMYVRDPSKYGNIDDVR